MKYKYDKCFKTFTRGVEVDRCIWFSFGQKIKNGKERSGNNKKMRRTHELEKQPDIVVMMSLSGILWIGIEANELFKFLKWGLL